MQKPEIETAKFRIESTRLKDWDYSKPWWYYVTINTKDYKHWFGKIENGKMMLNKFGKIADDYWNKIPDHYQSVGLDQYVIMPNHIHGIIILNDAVETGHAPSLQRPNLSNVIGSFKSAVTKHIHEIGIDTFKWQPRFYDCIIRNEKEPYKIRKYIGENPLKWECERDNDNSKSYKGQ